MTNTDKLTHAKALADLDAIPTAALDRLLRDIEQVREIELPDWFVDQDPDGMG